MVTICPAYLAYVCELITGQNGDGGGDIAHLKSVTRFHALNSLLIG